MKLYKVKELHERKDNSEMKYWVRIVGNYIGFKSYDEYAAWMNELKDKIIELPEKTICKMG